MLFACASAPSRPLQFVAGDGPEYPPAAATAGIEGYVVIGYDVTVDGRVTNAIVLDSQPTGVFEDAALAAVAQWRFNPPIEGGVVRSAPQRQSRIEFKLGDSAPNVP
jgi:protein TonB